MSTPQLEMPVATRAYVVGADHAFVLNSFARRLRAVGIEMVGHFPRDQNPGRLQSIPKGADAVIIIRNPIGHALQNNAVHAAQMAGVPVVQVPRRFSKALPLLREAKLTGDPLPVVSQDDLLQHLLATLQTGPDPSRSELLGRARRHFGPSVMVSDHLWSLLQKEARMQAVTAKPDSNALQSYAEILVEDKPEASLTDMVRELQELAEGWPESFRVGAIQKALETFKAKIRENPAFAEKAFQAWANRLFQANGVQSVEQMPSYRALQSMAEEVFGHGPSSSQVLNFRRAYLESITQRTPALTLNVVEPTGLGRSYLPSTIRERSLAGLARFNSLDPAEQTALRSWVLGGGEVPPDIQAIMEPCRGNPPVAAALMLCAVLPWTENHPKIWAICSRYRALFNKGMVKNLVRWVAQSFGVLEEIESFTAAQDDSTPEPSSVTTPEPNGVVTQPAPDLESQVQSLTEENQQLRLERSLLEDVLEGLQKRVLDLETQGVPTLPNYSAQWARIQALEDRNFNHAIVEVAEVANGRIDGLVRRFSAMEKRCSDIEKDHELIGADAFSERLAAIEQNVKDHWDRQDQANRVLLQRLSKLENTDKEAPGVTSPVISGEVTISELLRSGRSITIGEAKS